MLEKYKVYIVLLEKHKRSYNYSKKSYTCLANTRAMKINERKSWRHFTSYIVLSKSRIAKGANAIKPTTHKIFHLIPIVRKIITNTSSVGRDQMQSVTNVVN